MSLNFDQLVLGPAHAAFGEVNLGNPTPVYAPQGATSFPIDGVFDIPALDVLGVGDAPGISTRKPTLDIRAALLPAGVTPTQGDQVTVRGVDYTVADVRPDGFGLITLVLAETA